ncbi:MAG: hypothetical protein ACE5JD_07990 [Candidatus Methylomirabilia bacterium]
MCSERFSYLEIAKRQILAHLGLPTEVPRPPPARAADLFADIST